MISLEITVRNNRGVLEKISGLLRRKLYNIEYIHAEPLDSNKDITKINLRINGKYEDRIANHILHIEKIIEVLLVKLINEKGNSNK